MSLWQHGPISKHTGHPYSEENDIQKVKRKNQQDATNSMFIIKFSISDDRHNDARNMLRQKIW